jgi:uncharacterized protein
MNIELTALEARIIGSLIEKQITTPDQYPLSLNALTNASNQKSNRDPVMDLGESAVQQVVDGLIRKHMMIERSGFGSRVPKYQQVFCNSEFGSLKLDAVETAIICELLLRGPQTPGELRSRAARMCTLTDVQQIETALNSLMTRVDGPFVVRLAREPGRRDHCYMHLFSGEPEMATDNTSVIIESSSPRNNNDDDRLNRLEELVDKLGQELAALKQKLGD